MNRPSKKSKTKHYRLIEFGLRDIESAVKALKSHSDLVCGSFNGQILYSDIDDIESAYLKITGKTRTQFFEDIAKEQEQYKLKEQKHKEAIPELTKEWIYKGVEILDEKYLDLWIECVPIRLNDLYHGMELGACLDIVKELNTGCSLETAKSIIENQGHSGMSFSLVCSMVKAFCDRGEEFVSYVR